MEKFHISEEVSQGLIQEEIDQILVIWNYFTEAISYDKGQTEANEAISMAKDFNIPDGVALFVNVEPTYPVGSAFLQEWYDTIAESEYESGVYGVFDREQEVYTALEEATQDSEAMSENTNVWTSAPEVGITTEENAPRFNPKAPDDSLAWGWQCGIEAETCNIDTNVFREELLVVLR